MRRIVLFLLLALAASLVPAAGTLAASPASRHGGIPPPVTSDFNGDGHADLAVAIAFEGLVGRASTGAVSVLYGSASGLTAAGNQLWTEDSPSVAGVAKPYDSFGWAVTTADFDGDGYADLAVGVPFKAVGGVLNAGAVNVLFGSASGLTGAGNQYWTQESQNIADQSEVYDNFGATLSSGDFDGDGYADLVVGVREEDLGQSEDGEDAGAVHVIRGSPTGLVSVGSQFLTQDSPGIPEEPFAQDRFGAALAGGDVNGDGFDDLAVGVPGEDLGTFGTSSFVGDAGAAHLLYGSAGGLTVSGTQLWTQDSPGVSGVAEEADLFGTDAAFGDFNRDGRLDLVIGAFNEGIGSALGAGSVNALYGSASGLTATGNQLWTQNSPGVPDGAEENDRFGGSPSSGDLNGDGYPDLAVGVPNEGFGDAQEAGVVIVLFGSVSGLTGTGSMLESQDSPGIAGVAETNDHLGNNLGIGDFGGGGQADLGIGARTETLGSIDEAGALAVIYGSPGGPAALGNQFWTQNSPGILDQAEPGDWFSFNGVVAA